MDTETAGAVAEVPEVTAPAGFGEGAPEPSPEPPPAPETEPAPETPPRNWETIREELEADETLSSEYKAHIDDVTQKSRKEGHSEAQKRLQPLLERNRQLLSASAQGLKAIETTLREAIEDGADSRQIVKALQSNPDAWAAWNGHSATMGSYEGARSLLKLMSSDKDMAEQYSARIDAVLSGSDAAETVAADFVDAIVGSKEKAAEERGYKRGLEAGRKAQTEAQKAKERPGQGPSNVAGTPSGGSYRSKTEARILHTQGKISHQEMRQINRSSLPEQ